MKKILSIIAVILIISIVIIPSAVSVTAASVVAESEAVQKNTKTSGEYNGAVEVYRSNVLTYCSAYSMTDYIDTVMKMLSVYSHTHSNDVLNSSYSYLNEKYEHKNEGITSADYSIKIGINQLSEWAEYIKAKYNVSPIANNDYLLVLIEAYELQDKGYIDYALSGSKIKGYSAADIISYCSGSSFNSEKQLSCISSTFASEVVNMIISFSDIPLPGTNGNLNDIQKKIVKIALDYKNYSKNGVRAKGHYCLRFANDVVQAAGLNIKRADCAKCSGTYYGVSNDWNSIPVGAVIYCNKSKIYGHAGVYIGDGYVVHCTPYHGPGTTLLKTVENGYVLKESLNSFKSTYQAMCWGFSGAWTKQYPCQPGRFMKPAH